MNSPDSASSNSTDFFENQSFGSLVGGSLEGFLSDLRKNPATIEERYTSHRVRLDLVPTVYTPELVKTTRRVLAASQTVFASFLGVSVKTVRAWEQGVNIPQEAACRFMDEIRHNPEYWQSRLQQLAIRKTSKATT